VAEGCSGYGLLLPLLVFAEMAITQISEYFVLRQQVAYVARQAAHEIAYAYGNLGYTGMNRTASAQDGQYQRCQLLVDRQQYRRARSNQFNSGAQISTYFNIP